MNSPIIDIILTLCFLYLVCAVLVSSIHELILTRLKIRAIMLKEAIVNFLSDDNWHEIAKKLLGSPFIRSLKKSDDSLPSYIPAKCFSLALMDVINSENKNITSEAELREMLENHPHIKGDTKKMLIGLFHYAGDNIEKFREGIEDFYEDGMDRLTGWFKKKTRKWLITLAAISTLALNIDSIQITKTLWEKPELAELAAASAVESFRNDYRLLRTETANEGSDSTEYEKTGIVSETELDSLRNEFELQLEKVRSLNNTRGALGIPIGWSGVNLPSAGGDQGFDILGWITKIMGWLITIFAISLGAPFWFDLMNKFVNMRGTGNKPASKKQKKRNEE